MTAGPAMVLLATLSATPARAQLGLGLVPMRVELRAEPGHVYSGSFRLSSGSASTIRERAEVLDFYIDAEQSPQFEPELAQEDEYSCRKWLTLNPMETELPANGSITVRYTLRVPADAPPRNYHCAAGFTSLPPASELKGYGIRTAVRVVGAFYLTIGDPRVEGLLKEIKLEKVKAGEGAGLRAAVVLENSGLMYFRPAGTLAVIGQDGKMIETHDFTPLPVLPKRQQRFLFPLAHLAEGQPCSLEVKVDLGAGEIQEGTAIVGARINP